MKIIGIVSLALSLLVVVIAARPDHYGSGNNGLEKHQQWPSHEGGEEWRPFAPLGDSNERPEIVSHGSGSGKRPSQGHRPPHDKRPPHGHRPPHGERPPHGHRPPHRPTPPPEEDGSTFEPEDSTTVEPEESTTLVPEEPTTLAPEEPTTVEPEETTSVRPEENTTL